MYETYFPHSMQAFRIIVSTKRIGMALQIHLLESTGWKANSYIVGYLFILFFPKNILK